MRYCGITMVSRMLQLAKSFLVSQHFHVSHPQPSKTAHHKSTQVKPGTAQKSQCRQLQKSQHNKLGLRSNSPKFLDFSAQLYGLLKSEFLQKIEVKWPRVDHGQRWSTLQQKSPKQVSTKNSSFAPYVWGKKASKGYWTNQITMRECVMRWWENDFQVSPIYIHQWGCATHLLGMWDKSGWPCTCGK